MAPATRKTFAKFQQGIRAQRPIVFTFGRFQPPTTGHQKLIDTVFRVAQHIGGEPRVYPSRTYDGLSNPLPPAIKIKFLRALFPKVRVFDDPKAISPYAVAKQLSEQGYRTVYLVVGSDRVQEFSDTFAKYVKKPTDPKFDPTRHFGFDHFEVVSAGMRDPKAPGVEGMSGSKMRALALEGNFTEFMKGVPNKNTLVGREMYEAIRENSRVKKPMRLAEDTLLREGPHDPAIFKAIFLVGPVGAGKTTIYNKAIAPLGFIHISSDNAFEMLLDKHNIGMDTASASKLAKNTVMMLHNRAKELSLQQKNLAIAGRLGLCIDTTASDFGKIKQWKENLENLGYQTFMVFANVDNETSRRHNERRFTVEGGRRAPEEYRQEKFLASQQNLTALYKLFGAPDFLLVEGGTDRAISSVYRNAVKFANRELASPKALAWLHSYAARITEASTDAEITVSTGDRTSKRIQRTSEKPLNSLYHNNSGEQASGRMVSAMGGVAEDKHVGPAKSDKEEPDEDTPKTDALLGAAMGQNGPLTTGGPSNSYE